MAKEKSIIVIKKITIAGGGHHGGSWKVALADFMTAMMAFFLVMWLLNQSEDTKKAVSDYFSTPSMIEYNFQNFGVEVTLEKLFLDLVNEPMKAFQSFMEPIDKTPDLLDMGSAKVVAAYLADQLTDYAKNVTVNSEGFDFDIPDNVLFQRGSAKPIETFIKVMDKIKVVTTGLENAEINVTSALFVQSVPGANPQIASQVADERLDLISKKIQAGLEHNTVNVVGHVNVKEKKGEVDPNKLIGFIKISIRQKPSADGKPRRKLETASGEAKLDNNVYENLVHELTASKKKAAEEKAALKAEAKREAGEQLKKSVDEELTKELPPKVIEE